MNTLQFELISQKANPPTGTAAARAGRCPVVVSLLACAVLLLTNSQARAQSYTLDWWELSGGTTSTGGIYTVSGSIGQPDAGTLDGGQFALSGGFWGVIAPALQPPETPLLTIAHSSTNTVVLSWPSSASGFIVQQAADSNSTAWSDAGFVPADDGQTKSVVLPSTSGTRYYRLKK